MRKIYNFSAGPATLPEEVLEEAKANLMSYNGSDISVMEMSHRSADFANIIETAEDDIRALLAIPDNYKVLFMQGGATAQFAAIPMNLMKNKRFDYVLTGSWSKKAFNEAKIYGNARVAGTSEDKNFSYVPKPDSLILDSSADYVYICQNETIGGVTYKELPECGSVPLVSDVSSMFLSCPLDISKYGIVYGGVQKNVGPAGLAIVIIREDLIREDIFEYTPSILNYKKTADANSLMNTPNCWGIYMCGLTFKWLLRGGGLGVMQKKNEEKAALLYDYLDNSRLFNSPVEKDSRSIMNVPFVTGSDELDKKFIEQSSQAGLKSLKGHRSVGGMRASIYNAMPRSGVEALVSFMEKFEKENA